MIPQHEFQWFKSHCISSMKDLVIGDKYIKFYPFGTKKDLKIPMIIRIEAINIESKPFNNKVIVSNESGKQSWFTFTELENCLFHKQYYTKLGGSFCKRMSRYNIGQIKKTDRVFIDNFSNKYPEYVI